MAKLTLEEVKDYAVLPDDTLILVEIEKIDFRHVDPRPGNDSGDCAMHQKPGWDKLEFKCKIRDIPEHMKADGEYSELLGSNIWGSVAAKFTMHPDNKLRQWAEAILNMGELDPGFELDTELLEGRQAKAMIGHYDRKDGTRRHEIAGLLPPGPLGGASGVPDFLQQRPSEAAPVTQAPAQPAAPAQQSFADEDPPF